MLFKKLKFHLKKQLIFLWTFIFSVIFLSSAVDAAMTCTIAPASNNTYPDFNAAGQFECARLGGTFNSSPITSSSDTFYLYDIFCDYANRDTAFSQSGGYCITDETFADKEIIQQDANNSGEKARASSCEPINLITGNKYKIHSDIENISGVLSLVSPQLTRIFNSTSVSNRNFVIGKNWLHSYQRKLQLSDIVNSKLQDPVNPNHSAIMSNPSSACTNGFSTINGGVPQWKNNRCEIIKDGQYIGTLPIRTHLDPLWVDDAFGSYANASVLREDGNEIKFRQPYRQWPELPGTEWVPLSGDTNYQLSYSRDLVNGAYVTTYFLTDESNNVETYNKDGLLLSIKYPNDIVETLTYDVDNQLDRVENNIGKYIQFTYDANDKIASIIDDAGRVWQYQYDVGRLVKVINPDLTEKNYHYDDASFPNALTGLTDERGIRYSTFEYNTDGKAESSYLGAPTTPIADRVSNVIVDYTGNGFNTVTDSRGNGRKYHYSSDVIQNVMTQFDGPECINCVGGSKQYTYDINLSDPDASTLNLLSKTEYGQTTNYSSYDVKGNPGAITKAVGTTEEVLKTYEYDSRYQSKVSKITEPSVFASNYKTTNITYDDFANITSVVISGFDIAGNPISRTQTFTYDGPFHQLSKTDGARTDVDDWTLINYYADDPLQGNNRARMKSMTAPLGITLYDNINYTATGQMSSYISANNLQVDFTYYAGNDRLEAITQTDTATNTSRTTRITYLATGEVTSITTGYGTVDATTVTLEYDNARRLTRVYDGLGNYIKYTLDTEGNVTKESIYDSNDALKKVLNESFDAYNRSNITTQLNESVDITFSPDGTLDFALDGKGAETDYGYDSLLRLTTINQDKGGTNPETANALTQLGYDVQDNLTIVTDPNNGTTTTIYDDLGNMTSQTSPDTGTTTYTHDNAGNVASKTDAKGQLFQYSYDELNRLNSIAGPVPVDDISMNYDSCFNGVGRLCRVNTTSASTHYSYTALGEISQHQSITYAYDNAGRIAAINYPSGASVQYGYDSAGQVDNVSLTRNGSTTVLASVFTYSPFGEIENLTYGNNLPFNQSFDQAYRVTSKLVTGVMNLSYDQYDNNGNIESIDDLLNVDIKDFTYDAHNRLDTFIRNAITINYDYDKNGNRVNVNDNGFNTIYAYENLSNRLDTKGGIDVQLDFNGNTTADGIRTFIYTTHNRLKEVQDSSVSLATYEYNGLGQRIKKTYPDATGRRFIYGTEGQLLAETDINGNVLNEYIYLNGQLLVKYEADSDKDGITNAQEDVLGTNPIVVDSDGDGLSNNDELTIHGTSPYLSDSDGDGVSDFNEITLGTNPLDANDVSLLGDINQDGVINTGDLVLSQQIVLGILTPDITQSILVDMNQDGNHNVVDLLLLQKIVLGVSTSSIQWLIDLTGHVRILLADIMDLIIPPAMAAQGDGAIYYVHNDHLGTPQAMSNEVGVRIWSAQYDAFGLAVVDEDVDGDGTSVELNVRFPGQYYDQETELHYNYFRYYDPATGRYITSDPIGLAGGLNTFVYVGGNPLGYVDPLGLDMFRPDNHEYKAGREGHDYVPTGGTVGKIIDDYVPAGHTAAEWHDILVGALVASGVPDKYANYPTVGIVYFLALRKEIIESVTGVSDNAPVPAQCRAPEYQ